MGKLWTTIQKRFKDGIGRQLARKNTQDEIEIGNIVEGALNGAFGEVMRQIMNGLVEDQLLESSRQANIPADRYLGRIEMITMLQDRLELCIDRKRELVEVQIDKQRIGGVPIE